MSTTRNLKPFKLIKAGDAFPVDKDQYTFIEYKIDEVNKEVSLRNINKNSAEKYSFDNFLTAFIPGYKKENEKHKAKRDVEDYREDKFRAQQNNTISSLIDDDSGIQVPHTDGNNLLQIKTFFNSEESAEKIGLALFTDMDDLSSRENHINSLISSAAEKFNDDIRKTAPFGIKESLFVRDFFQGERYQELHINGTRIDTLMDLNQLPVLQRQLKNDNGVSAQQIVNNVRKLFKDKMKADNNTIVDYILCYGNGDGGYLGSSEKNLKSSLSPLIPKKTSRTTNFIFNNDGTITVIEKLNVFSMQDTNSGKVIGNDSDDKSYDDSNVSEMEMPSTSSEKYASAGGEDEVAKKNNPILITQTVSVISLDGKKIKHDLVDDKVIIMNPIVEALATKRTNDSVMQSAQFIEILGSAFNAEAAPKNNYEIPDVKKIPKEELKGILQVLGSARMIDNELIIRTENEYEKVEQEIEEINQYYLNSRINPLDYITQKNKLGLGNVGGNINDRIQFLQEIDKLKDNGVDEKSLARTLNAVSLTYATNCQNRLALQSTWNRMEFHDKQAERLNKKSNIHKVNGITFIGFGLSLITAGAILSATGLGLPIGIALMGAGAIFAAIGGIEYAYGRFNQDAKATKAHDNLAARINYSFFKRQKTKKDQQREQMSSGEEIVDDLKTDYKSDDNYTVIGSGNNYKR